MASKPRSSKARGESGATVAAVLPRLEAAVASGELAQEAADLVLGALEDLETSAAAETADAADDGKPSPKRRPSAATHLKEGEPPGVHLRSITAQGFRGIGPPATLELVPGPGLTLVVGRNGSGKSSFAEALEILLTGDNQRWAGRRGKIWKEGWSNLHWKKARHVAAELAIEGTDGPTTLRRTWKAGAALDDDTFEWKGPAPRAPSGGGAKGASEASRTSRGDGGTNGDTPWTPYLTTHRPFLSYNELGSLLEEGPSKLYDALASILGLGELVGAADALKATRKELRDHSSATKKRRKEIRAALEATLAPAEQAAPDEKKTEPGQEGKTQSDEPAEGKGDGETAPDPRIERALDLTRGTKWKLDDLDRLLSGSAAPDDGTSEDTQSLLQQLSRIGDLPLPDPAAIREAAEDLERKADALRQLTGTDSAAAHRIADLLEKALENYDRLVSEPAEDRAPATTATPERSQPSQQRHDTLSLLLQSIREERPEPGESSESSESSGSSEARADDAAALRDPGTCPVCKTEGVLTPTWRETTTQEIERLRETARAYDDASTALDNSGEALRHLLVAPPQALRRAAASGVLRRALEAAGLAASAAPTAVLESWRTWSELTELPSPTDLETRAARLRTALGELQTAATLALEAREERWRPHARALSAWLEDARREMAERERQKALKAAEDWLRSTTTTLRNERFAPIKEQVQQIWEELRTASSVSLDDVTFEGRSTQRRIELAVTVDGEEGAALGVMSQGELHALALSLFLPRATLPQSPFRFLMIDDPVQAMDPARVDGLARVLARTAHIGGGRQVVVFTHDNRLPEAIRRLALDATILEVERDPGSKVTVTPSLDPVERHLAEARALVRTDDVPVDVIENVVPVLCRQALEAAAIESVRKRRIGRGEPHSRVEDLLTTNTRLYPRLALALFDDPDRAGDVLGHLNGKNKTWADLATACNKGAHEGLRGVDTKFVDATKKLAEHLRSLR